MSTQAHYCSTCELHFASEDPNPSLCNLCGALMRPDHFALAGQHRDDITRSFWNGIMCGAGCTIFWVLIIWGLW